LAPDPTELAQRLQRASLEDGGEGGRSRGQDTSDAVRDPGLVESMDRSVEAALMVLKAAESELAAEARAFTDVAAKKERLSVGRRGRGGVSASDGAAGWKGSLRSDKRPATDARSRRRRSIAEVEEHLESAN